jgi:ATP/maltotriose-dependent transcriptional regulator MalT/DNA-binding SARP family transcriptional activator
MPRSFRYVPPDPRADVLTRPRLLRALLGRWHHRVTCLIGGPGLGKTTLLAQAIAENRLAPRGTDLWIGVEARDADHTDRLATAVATAMAHHAAAPARAAANNGTGGANGADGASGPTGADDVGAWTGEVDAISVADALWHLAPDEICLVLDDVHLLTEGSAGAAWLAALVDALPANGHVLLASRTEPAIPLARLSAQAAVLRVGEGTLRFTGNELATFAERRGIEPARLGDRSEWPAVAELTATVGHDVADNYLWEEILEPLGPQRRRVLGVLCELGGADDCLVSAAIGAPAELSTSLDGVPLVARGADGWHVAHALWHDAPGVALAPEEVGEVRQRAVTHLTERERFDDAFAIIREAGLWDLAPDVLRQAALGAPRRTTGELEVWLATCPPVVRESVGGMLAESVLLSLTDPVMAVEALTHTAHTARQADDLDVEMMAIAQLGRLTWFTQGSARAGRDVGRRVVELQATGHPVAQALFTFGRAIIADVRGDDAACLAQLERIDRGVLDPAFEAMADLLRGIIGLDMGDTEGALVIAERVRTSANRRTRPIFHGLRLRALYVLGRIDELLAELPARVAAVRATGVVTDRYLIVSHASAFLSHFGDVEGARRFLDELLPLSPPGPDETTVTARTAMVIASLQLAEGDEDGAAATLAEAMETQGLEKGIDRRAWRQTLAISYVLVPATREHWDAQPLEAHLRTARDLAQAVVAVREGGHDQRLRNLELPEMHLVRAALHHRLAAELAVGLSALGRPEGPHLLEELGPPGRAAVRAMATNGSRNRKAKLARSLLAVVPQPPAEVTWLGVLGPLDVRRPGRDGAEVVDNHLRRKRLRALLAFLIGHRTTDRSVVAATLWPDHDEKAAANNLAVTLSYLLQLLEPERPTGEPAYTVRVDGQTIKLVTGEHLQIDTDVFDEHLALAAAAEANGAPSLALEHNLAAVDLYRGDLHADLPDADWALIDREHYRTRFLSAGVRAGQLLVARGDTDQAEAIARRVLTVDPWNESGHAVLVNAALAVGDRATARRRFDACLEALDELGMEPSDATQQLRRRMRAATGLAPSSS